jgi:hypothetical protein
MNSSLSGRLIGHNRREQRALVQAKKNKFKALVLLAMSFKVRNSLAPPLSIAATAALLATMNKSRVRPYIYGSDLSGPAESSWANFLQNAHSRSLQKYTRLDRHNFDFLLQAFGGIYLARSMQFNVSQFTLSLGHARPHRRALSAELSFLLSLRYIAGDPFGDDISLLVGVPQATRSRSLRFSLLCLREALRMLPDARISFPQSNEEARRLSRLGEVYTGGAFPNVIGTKDGTMWYMEEPAIDQDVWFGRHENAHGNRSVFVWLWDGTCALAGINFVGGRNDGYIDQFINIDDKMAHLDPIFKLISDSGFRGSDRVIRAITATELAQVQDAHERDLLWRLGRWFRRLRSTSEWGNGSLEKAFGVLQSKASGDDLEFNNVILEICARMHNFRVRRMGIGQLHTVMKKLGEYFA